MEEKKCFNCQSSEQEVPVVSLKYKGKDLWVCPRCIPSMIHEPQLVQTKLDSSN